MVNYEKLINLERETLQQKRDVGQMLDTISDADATLTNINPERTEKRSDKLWRPKGFVQYEVIINVLVSSF